MRGCSNSTGQVRRCQLPKGERAWGPQAPGTRHSTPPLGFGCMGCLPKLVLAFLDAMYPPLSFLRPPRPPRFESALRMESPTHKIDHPSSSLSVIMLTQSLPSFPSPSILPGAGATAGVESASSREIPASLSPDPLCFPLFSSAVRVPSGGVAAG